MELNSIPGTEVDRISIVTRKKMDKGDIVTTTYPLFIDMEMLERTIFTSLLVLNSRFIWGLEGGMWEHTVEYKMNNEDLEVAMEHFRRLVKWNLI